jgi:hypothetical protein
MMIMDIIKIIVEGLRKKLFFGAIGMERYLDQ